MSSMTPPRPIDELEWLSLRRKETERSLEKSRQRMRTIYADLTSAPTLPDSKWGRILSIADRVPSIYQGIRTGYRVASVLSAVMAFTHLFKRKR